MIHGAEKSFKQQQRAATNPSIPPGLYEGLSALAHRAFCAEETLAPCCVLLTAVHPRSGVSYLSSCLSTLIAEEYGESLLVDGQVAIDMARAGTLPKRADCTPIRPSRLWVLGRTEAARMTTDHTNITSAGGVLKSLLAEIEYAVVDCPALSVSSAAEILSPEVDAVILVVVPHETDINDIHAARIKLTAAGGQILGAVYNTAFDPSDTGF